MSLVDEEDLLYERCVTAPDRCGDQYFADWAEGVASSHDLDRTSARLVRRCMRAGQRLAAFWIDRDPDAAESWRASVDVALGPRAWRPQLELAQHLLAQDPSEQSYAAVADLFPLVFNEPYLDGASYDEWSEAERSV